jgi:predicted phage terminase large subunit-like protein
VTVQLTAELIESFAGVFLSPRYDNARPTPQFHRDAWKLYASQCKQAMVVAPRGHAKSTGLTYDYILAEVCFRVSDYVILIGSTEDKAAEQLSNISEELETNEDLRREFGLTTFESQTKTEVIMNTDDGHRFRILARGAEQKIRGAMWKGKRPNLIVCDDMEDDEQVENKDRRSKFRRWFFRAAKQALSKSGKIRVHGTILHDDSLLARLRNNKAWTSLFYKAHKSYDDFSELLWPEQWSEADLRAIRVEFEQDGDSGGYSQEYLNTPLDNADAYLRERDFLPMGEDDYAAEKKFGVGVDFAISKKEAANRTSFTVGGKCSRNLIHHVDQHVGRWDSLEIIEKFFEINNRWHPECFFVEHGKEWLAIQPVLNKEMQRRNQWLVVESFTPVGDKAIRGRVFQKKMKAGACRYDNKAEWYESYKAELLTFTGSTDAKADDQFDSTAILHKGLEMNPEVEQEDFMTEEEEEWFGHSQRLRGGDGRSATTGY